MTNFEYLKVVRIGTLHFIPVTKSTRTFDLSSFNLMDEPSFGQPRIIATSGEDRFHDADGSNWVVVDVPAHHNGELRSIDDVVRHLEPVFAFLYQKGLLPNMEFPGLVVASPFDLVPQMA